MVKEPSLPYYLPIAGERITGFIFFVRVFMLCEVQTSSVQTWVTVSIFYDGNDFSMNTHTHTHTHTHIYIYIYIYIYI